MTPQPSPHATRAETARYYHRLGFRLCAIPPGTKGPTARGWPEANTPPEHWDSHPQEGIGVVLGPSRLVSLDLDHLPHSRAVLAAIGLDLDALLAGAILVRGNPERLRAIFRAPPDLDLSRKTLAWPSEEEGAKPITVFELRGGAVQDVLPPTIHPGTGLPYEWITAPWELDERLATLPTALLELWRDWDRWHKALVQACPWAAPAPEPQANARQSATGAAGPSVVSAFNEAHDIGKLLANHGYRAKGEGRWIAPSSESGLAGVVLLPSGKVFSHHGADPLADGFAHDCFDVFRLLDHAGDQRQAVKAAARLLGMDRPPRADTTQGKAEDSQASGAAPLAPEEVDRLLAWAAHAGATLPDAEAIGIFQGPRDSRTGRAPDLLRVNVRAGTAFTAPWRQLLWNHGPSSFMSAVGEYLPNRAKLVDKKNLERMAKGEHPQPDEPAENLRSHAQAWLASILALAVSEVDGRALLARLPAAWPEPTPLPERGDVGEAAPFPLAILPEALHAAAYEVARFTKVDPAAPALVGIGTLATAIGKRAMIEERPGLHHHPALFLAGIACTGERKSPVFRDMARPLEDWSAKAAVAWEEAARKGKAKNMAIDAALTATKGKAKSGNVDAAARDIDDLEAQRPNVPAYPRLFTSDATEQRLFQLMHERGGAFAVLSGEGRPVIDAILGKYSGDGRTGDGVYLAGVSGDTITRDRVGNGDGPEDRVITRPCLTVCVLIQPDKYLEAATHPSLRASGALARIWPVWLPSLVGTRMEAPDEAGLSPETMTPYTALVRRLLDHEPPTDADGHPIPHRATLSPEAREARRIFHNEVERLMGEGGELDDVRDIASKAVSQTAKLALVLHLAADPEALARPTSEIGAHAWATAQTIGTWFLTEAVRVQRLADEDPGLEAARRILRWLRSERRATVTARDLQREGPRPRPKARQAIETLTMLADYGWLQPNASDRGRANTYQVHPSVANVANVAKERP